MLTVVELLSVAGERRNQNDDACGAANGCAWVLDGATDLHSPSLTGSGSDAAWISHLANSLLHARASAGDAAHLRSLVRDLSGGVATAYSLRAGKPPQHWMMPLASLLLIAGTRSGVCGLDLGDCRFFAVGQDGAAHAVGGPAHAADDESRLAETAARRAQGMPLLDHPETMAMLRSMRNTQNQPGAEWTFCPLPECADHARTWEVSLTRPAHILICTDGFSALVDRYHAYDTGGLVHAALDKGLAKLAGELRAIEADDLAGEKHPRWKKCDDATAVLLRLES
ncbi:MAG: hypothetical protein ABI645_10345 [Pseudomonadota bacterium]